MRTCPSCRRFLQGDTTFCSSCGATLGNTFGASDSSGFDFDFGGSTTSGSTSFGSTEPEFNWGFGSGSSQPSTGGGWSFASGLPAPRWKRLLGFVLDLVLATLTLGIGWWVWFLVIASRGQTPAKQILKLQVVHAHSPSSTWPITVFRYVALAIPGWIFAIVEVFGLISLPYSMMILWNVITWVFWMLPLVDALFIFMPRQQRLIDMVLKTQVVNR